MNANWDDLRVFLAVARDESLSAAGRRLQIDPATVGRRIARLEEAYETPLFAKSPQGYALTNEGHRLLAHAERAEVALDAADDELAASEKGLSGTVRIGAPDGAANFLLPRVVTQICRENPDLEIQIVAMPRVISLSRREADMVISVSLPSGGRLITQKIADYKLHLAAARFYLRHAPPLETLEDLKNHRIVGYIPDMIFDKALDFQENQEVPPADIASNSASAQFQLVRHGAGVGIVHDFAVPHAKPVQRVLTDQLSLTRSYYLIRHADDARLERMNRLAELLVSRIRAEVHNLEAELDNPG